MGGGADSPEPPIREAVRGFIVSEFLYGEHAGAIEGSTPLISGGILDSISIVKLVEFLEKTYGIRLEPHEMDEDHLDNLDMIAELVKEKRA